jgi:hypothetical protein
MNKQTSKIDDDSLMHCEKLAIWDDCDKCNSNALCYLVTCQSCDWAERDCDTTIHLEAVA